MTKVRGKRETRVSLVGEGSGRGLDCPLHALYCDLILELVAVDEEVVHELLAKAEEPQVLDFHPRYVFSVFLQLVQV